MNTRYVFQPTSVQQLRDHYDLIIVGSGAAGLTSALQVVELGLQPVILEKMPRLGGNSSRASSGMNAAETLVQLQHHIVDSYQDFYQDTWRGGGQQNDPGLLHYFTEHAAAALTWLSAHDINLTDLTWTGAMTVQRTHRPASQAPIGSFLITELLKQIEQAQIPVFTKSVVQKLLMSQQRVTGVRVQIDGTTHQLHSKAVILATGGFGASTALLQKYRPDLVTLATTNQPGTTGDGLQLAQQIGAQLVDMQQVQVHPTVNQEGSHPYLIGEALRGEGAILVNAQGQRFVNELATRKQVTAAINQLPGKTAMLIFDQQVRQRVPAINFYEQIGLVQTGNSWEELAQYYAWPVPTFLQTIATWNQAVTKKQDRQWQRTTGLSVPLTQAPFYAIKVAPAVHYTMGGLAITPQTQVLNQQQQVIPGLFAAGEVTGGLHGNNRLGGNSIAETVVFGRQAAQQVFKYCQHWAKPK